MVLVTLVTKKRFMSISVPLLWEPDVDRRPQQSFPGKVMLALRSEGWEGIKWTKRKAKSFQGTRNSMEHGKSVSHFSWVAQSCPTLCHPMNRSTPGLPVHHQLPEFTQTHVHPVGDAIQPSHPLSSPSPPAPNPSQYQSLFQWVNSSHEVAKVLEFQL